MNATIAPIPTDGTLTLRELHALLGERIPEVLAAGPATRDEVLEKLGILGTHAGYEARSVFEQLAAMGEITESPRPGEASLWAARAPE